MTRQPETEPSREAYREEIARLPLTMRPRLNQQLSGWDYLFPFEQNRLAQFLRGLSLYKPEELNALTRALRALELKMGVTEWSFSVLRDTMANASQLARSPYYVEWRREVQRVFTNIELKAADSAHAEPPWARLIFLILPDSLPIKSIPGAAPWDTRGVEFKISGDSSHVSEMAFRGSEEIFCNLVSQSDPGGADCWVVDAEARLGKMLGSCTFPISILEYRALQNFRDRFLSEANTVPKDIEGADEILEAMRNENWEEWWPPAMRGQARLRNFVVELFLSGNGALIFPNAFVQWACSEALRRARPRLLVGRFGLRMRPKPFTSIAIFENQQKISRMEDIGDPEGSAIDALILARYVWLSALRYPESEQTSCVCISESSGSGYLIAPEARRPAWSSQAAVSPEEICDWMRLALG